jgi:transcriptional regulator with XRE-family HTH domain
MGFTTLSRMAADPLACLFGTVIRIRRESAGLSQEELAERTGVSRNYIGMVERGETNPTLRVIQNLAKSLATSMTSLVSELEARATEAAAGR